MSYSTVANMIEKYGETDLALLSDRSENHPSVIDHGVIERAIKSADAEIDMHLQTRYPLPLSSVPQSLIDASMTLAYANLNPKQTKDSPEYIAAEHHRDILKRLSEGKLTLGLDEDNQEPPMANTVQISEGRNDFGGRNW